MKKNQNNNDNCPRCGNPWSYGSGIYCGGIIRRYCSCCHKKEVGVVTKWRKEWKNQYSEEFDHEIWD